MITMHNGDLLQSDCDIICHQVNLQGVMGGGIARQIALKYPEVEKDYKAYVKCCKKYDCCSIVCFSQINGTNKYVANCFSQEENFDTNYLWLEDCFNLVKKFAGKKCKIGVPFGYGCGIANGDWDIVYKIFENIFTESDVDLQIWKVGDVI